MIILWTSAAMLIVISISGCLKEFSKTFAIIGSTPGHSKLFLVLTTVAASVSMLQISLCTAKGLVIHLGLTQNIGKILSLVFVVVAQHCSIDVSAVDCLSAIQVLSAVPSVVYLWRYIYKQGKRVEGYQNCHSKSFKRFFMINGLAAFNQFAFINIIEKVFGASGVSYYSLGQKMYSPATTLFQSGARNLWAYFRKQNVTFTLESVNKCNKMRILGSGIIIIICIGSIIFHDLLESLVGLRSDNANLMLIVGAANSVFMIWSAFSFVQFAAIGRETLTHRVVLAQAIGLLAIWTVLSNRTDPCVAIGVFILMQLILLVTCYCFEMLLVKSR